ncbi:O-antigen ligase family protein [Vibrio anguillarum]|uniref:O-antigen ligase family protein n=1 Tax=Vibrio anguillarum TaxID=55601 RepID=UPI00188D9A8E|nr:O-antigen ligase [Vibrio anguillarum]MBF4256143.1 O-antigen ligase family protein [Vibrio anguillarum]MBF4276715.1 O-antigen ligase family protein [Vibrio anguillarum]MBF4297501.1 O-antigen ligase family protein [Vibrio anguillarum]MBF4361198.1 O-antigen ligase family protein [Vibrio anguillarum]MBF4397085.1 O-antigen ligase family protein [Vibrio anguillarum]
MESQMNKPLNVNSFALSSLFLVPALLLSTNNFSVVIVAFIVLFSIHYLVKNRTHCDFNKYDLLITCCLGAYFFANLPITIADGSTFRYFQGGSRLLLCIPIYLMFRKAFILRSTQAYEWLSIGVIVGSFGALVLALYQFVILHMPRVDGFLFSINFGYLACSLAFLALCLSIKSKYKYLLLLAFIASIISTVLTLTRGAIFSIPLLLIFCALLNWKKLNLKLTSTFIVGFIALSLGTYWNSDSVKQRIDYTAYEVSHIISGDVEAATSTGTRLYLWKAATEAFKQSPFIGLPYDERETLNKQLYAEGKVNEYTRNLTRGHAHSQYFELLASNGILGIVAIIMMLAVPFVVFTQHYRKTDSLWGYTGTVFVAGFILFCLTEAPLQANLISAFYGFMLATFFALIRIEKYNAVQQPN